MAQDLTDDIEAHFVNFGARDISHFEKNIRRIG